MLYALRLCTESFGTQTHVHKITHTTSGAEVKGHDGKRTEVLKKINKKKQNLNKIRATTESEQRS